MRNFCIIILLIAINTNCYAQSSGYLKFALPVTKGETTPPLTNQSVLLPSNSGILSVTNDVVDGTDMHIHPSINPQSEVHISINKLFPSNILVSSNTTFGLGNSIQGYYYTTNGGTSWAGADILPNNAYGRGDPSTCFDADGNGYLVSMAPDATSSPDGYFVQKTTSLGVTWGTQIRGTGPTANFDKEMVAADNTPSSSYANNFYCAWTDFTGSYSVKFNRSTNGGSTFTTPITLKSGWGQGTNVQTGPNGEVYVCWANYGTGTYPANGIGFSSSTNGGVNFTTKVAFSYAGIRVSGVDPLFNNTRVNDFPSMAVDKSCGTNRGRIYIAYPTKENGTGKSIIQVRNSSDGGNSWSSPITVSIASGRQNWFPWISVDDATGVVSVVYYSLDAVSGFTTNTYVAYSLDGGATYTNIKVSDQGHITAPIPGFGGGYAGDYIGIASFGGKAYASWADDRNGTWQVYVSPLTFDVPVLFSSNTDINVNGPLNYTSATSSITYQAVNSINVPSTSTFSVQSGVNLTMIAGNSVTLLPGFSAISGSTLNIYIANVSSCSNTKSAKIDSHNFVEKIRDQSTMFSNVICYPNPTTNNITFSYSLLSSTNVVFVIQDVNGKTLHNRSVAQQSGDNKYTFNVSRLSPGIYFYKLSANKESSIGKFVK